MAHKLNFHTMIKGLQHLMIKNVFRYSAWKGDKIGCIAKIAQNDFFIRK